MHNPKIRPKRLKTARGIIRADYLNVEAGRVCVLVSNQVKKRPKYCSGTIFVRNRELASTSPKGTEWMACASVYQALRMNLKIDRNSGNQQGIQNGELQLLFANDRAVRDYIHTLLDPVAFLPEDAERHRVVFDSIVRDLASKRNRNKVLAEVDFIRAQKMTDSRGRRNPMAAAMAGGGGKGRLRDRQKEIRAILGYVSMRTFRIHALIQDTMQKYEDLLSLLGGRSRKTKSGVLWQLAESPQSQGMRRSSEILGEQVRIFSQVYAEPYLNNVRWLARDLKEARGLTMVISVTRRTPRNAARIEDELGKLKTCYLRIRQGIAWALALHFLEMRVITPLSLLMDDVKRDERMMRRAVHAPRNEEVVVRREFAPRRFDLIVERIEDFRRRASRCSDTHLRTRVREPVLAHTVEALEFVGHDDWAEVKHQLKNASGVLGVATDEP